VSEPESVPGVTHKESNRSLCLSWKIILLQINLDCSTCQCVLKIKLLYTSEFHSMKRNPKLQWHILILNCLASYSASILWATVTLSCCEKDDLFCQSFYHQMIICCLSYPNFWSKMSLTRVVGPYIHTQFNLINLCISMKISAERYFKIPHYLILSQALFSLYFYFFYRIFNFHLLFKFLINFNFV